MLRAVAPTQVAAAVMLAAGGISALVAPPSIGLIGLIGGAVGAVATIGAGSWQGARYAARRQSAGGCGSGQGCGGCAKICGSWAGPSQTGSVAADVDGVSRQDRHRQRLAAQHPRPQVHPRLHQNIGGQCGEHDPVVALDFALELADGPAG